MDYNNQIHEKCIGCNRYKTFTEKDESRSVCVVYINPSMWWEKRNGCPLATHTKKIMETDEKVRVGQQKQKKKKKKVV